MFFFYPFYSYSKYPIKCPKKCTPPPLNLTPGDEDQGGRRRVILLPENEILPQFSRTRVVYLFILNEALSFPGLQRIERTYIHVIYAV